MGDNKKKKVDFSTALQAQAKKLAPKFDPADEEFIANINGEDVKFVRGDSTDEEWAAIKKAPSMAQRVTVVPDPSGGSPASRAVAVRKKGESDADWKARAAQFENHPRYEGTVDTTEADQRAAKREQYKMLVQNQAYEGGEGSLVSKDELKLLRKMNPEAAADFIEERLKKREYADEAARENSKKLKDDPNERPSTVDLGLKKQDQGTPEEWKGVDAGRPVAPTKPQTEDDNYVGSNTFSPLSQAMQFAKGALPAQQLTPDQQRAQERLKEQEANVARVNAQGEKHGREDLQTVKNFAEGFGPMGLAKKFDDTVTEFMQPANEAVVGAARKANDLLTPVPAPNEQQMAAREDLGLDPLTAEPPLNAPVAQPQQPPVQNPMMGPGNVSASMGVKIPGGFKPAQADPQYQKNLDESIAAAKKRADDLADLQGANELVQDAIVRESGKRRLEAEAQMNQEAALAAQAKLNAVNEAQRYNGARQAALDAAQKAAQTPTDPNRYWNNKEFGQKAAAVIAGALYGFTGQGMQWLQRIDGLIENDQRLQVADRAAKVQGLESQARGFGEAADFAMKAGASEAEAHIIARQMKLESLNSYLQQMTARSQNMQQKMMGQQMLVAMGEKMAALDMQAQQLNAQQVAEKNTNLFRNAQLGQEAASMRLKMSGAGGGEQVRGPQAMELGALAAASKVAEDLRKQFGEKNVLSRLFDKPAALLPGTDATKYNLARQQAVNMIAPMMGAGVLQKHDLDRWEQLMAKSGDLNGEEMLNILVTDINRLYNEKRGALQSAGFAVQNFPVMGNASMGAPAYATPR